MKYCLIYRQSYFDETLNFCLEDGSHLVTEEFILTSPTIAYHGTFEELISHRSLSGSKKASMNVLSVCRGCWLIRNSIHCATIKDL